jgi:hypothetical protein
MSMSPAAAGDVAMAGIYPVVGNNNWPAADRAIFVPFVLHEPMVVQRMAVFNALTATGNVDVGIYTEDGTRLVSAGSTAMSGTVAIQSFSISITLAPGRYYMALAFSSASANIKAATTSLGSTYACGILQMASAFPLPATATFAAPTSAYIPAFGISSRSFF